MQHSSEHAKHVTGYELRIKGEETAIVFRQGLVGETEPYFLALLTGLALVSPGFCCYTDSDPENFPVDDPQRGLIGVEIFGKDDHRDYCILNHKFVCFKTKADAVSFVDKLRKSLPDDLEE